MKSWPELTEEFLNSLISKSDDELIELISERFVWEGEEDETLSIDEITNNGEATLIDDPDGFRRGYGFQVLALLAATNKQKTFEIVRNHFLAGKSINGFDGTIKYLASDDPCFDSKEDELAIRSNPKWIFITKEDEFGGPSQEELYMFKSASISASDFDEDCSINISEVGCDFLRDRMKVDEETVTFILPRSLFGKYFPNQSIIDNSEHITNNEFGDLPPNPTDVIVVIRLESIEL